MTANGYGASFWGDEMFWNETVVMVAQLSKHTKKLFVHLKRVNCMARELHVNETAEKPKTLEAYSVPSK